jgi:RNA polymerase sigma-70 factor (ECF subfamily)
LYRQCFAILRDEDAAEDIAQETFIAAYYKLSSFDQSKRFSTWLFKIATNKALNYIRSRKYMQPVDEVFFETIVSSHGTPELTAEHDELHRAITGLDPKYRAIVHLYYFEGMDYREIAEVLSKPQGSIKGWMNRAKNELRKELA